MSKFISAWYLLYTQPRQEKKILTNLSKANIEAFLPTVTRLKKTGGRQHEMGKPLFPSYIFVYPKSIREYFYGAGADGVVSYVRFGNELARVDSKLIDNLKIILRNDQDIEVSSDQFDVGEKLVVQKGALLNLECELIEYNGNQKIL